MLKRLKDKLNRNENNKNILYNVLGAFSIKGGALVVSLLTIPAYLKFFENEAVLGLWFTILSVLSWSLTFDLGLGNGLRNHLVKAFVRKETVEIKSLISSAYIIISLIGVLSLSIAFLTFDYFNWNKIFNVNSDLITNEILNNAVLIVFSGIMMQFSLKLISSILYSLQKSAVNNFLSLISSILVLVYVSLANPNSVVEALISLSIIYAVAYNLPILIITIVIFSNELKLYKPNIKFFSKESAKNVLKLGGIFFWVQIMFMVITTTNEFLISWLTTPSMVVEYQIYNKLFTIIGTVFMLALTPIWSAVTKALAEKNFSWILKLYRILKWMALIAVFCEFALILFLQTGVNFWLKEDSITINYFYAITFAIYGSILVWNGVLSTIANGFGELKSQSILFTFAAVIKIPLAILMVEYFNSWIGVVIANILALSLYCIIQPIWLSHYLKKNINGVEESVQK